MVLAFSPPPWRMGTAVLQRQGETLKCSGSLRSGKLVLEGRPRVVSAPRPLGAA